MKRFPLCLLLAWVLAGVLSCLSLRGQRALPVLVKGMEGKSMQENMPDAAGTYADRSGVERRTLLVQFAVLPTAGEMKAMELRGVFFEDYIPHHTWLVSVPVYADAADLFAGAEVRFAPFSPTYKIHPQLVSWELPDYAIDEDGRAIVNIVLMHDAGAEQVTASVVHNGCEVEQVNAERGILRVHLPMEKVAGFAKPEYVKWMEPIQSPGEPEDVMARSLHRSNTIDADYSSGRHYDGTGIKGCINDDGIVGPHIDFTGRLDQSTMTIDGGSHGDMTTGILTGAGNLNPNMKGMASGAFVHVLDYDATMPNTVTLYLSDTVTIISTSYSDGCNGGYNSTAAAIDLEMHSYPEILQFFSAGNNGTSDCGYEVAGQPWGNITGGHKMAKNAVCVGNLYADDAREATSSRGPATDGRLKPDLSANGQGQMSTDANHQYQLGGGTSAASPGAAGVGLQLSHAHQSLWGSLPAGALLRAILQNTADDLGNAGPDFTFGWGRVNGLRAVKAIEQHRFLQDSVSAGGVNTHNITVPSGVAEMRCMITWADKEGSMLASKALVNDLDLTVTTPSAATLYPLVLNPAPLAATLDDPAVPGVDTLNNTEQVMIIAPASGSYDVHVTGSEVPFGPQEYYLTWEFLYDSITVTYPMGGEGFVPGETERIRWDAYDTTGVFQLQYTTNSGITWANISTSVPGSARLHDWTIPTVISGQVAVRVSRAGKSGRSAADFTINTVPMNLQIDWVCPDSFKVSWDFTTGATQYEVLLLGDRYMESAGITSATHLVIHGVPPTGSEWVTVRALGPAGLRSRRAIAIERPPGLTGCTLADDAGVTKALTPPAGSIPSCLVTGPIPVSVEVTNAGINDLTGLQVSYSLDGSAAVTETLAGTLSSGSTAIHTFSPAITLTPGVHTLKTWTSYASDGNVYNDTLSYLFEEITGATVSTLVWNDDFESQPLCAITSDCGATVCDLGTEVVNEESGVFDDHDWRVWEGSTPSGSTGPDVDHTSGSSSGNYVYLEPSGGCTEKTASLLTPCFDLSSGATTPAFTFWYHMYGMKMGDLHVDAMSTDLVWQEDVYPVLSGNQGNLWKFGAVSLVPYIGRNVVLRIRGITGVDFDSDMALDDLGFDKASSAVHETAGSLSLRVFPNPARDHFSIEVMGAQCGVVDAEILNLLMQPVRKAEGVVKGGNCRMEMDVSLLPAGIYYCKVKCGEVCGFEKVEVMR